MNAVRPSALIRLAACPTSAALPQTDSVSVRSFRGVAIHEFLADYLRYGPAAYDRVPVEYRSICHAINVDRLPVGVGTVSTEVELKRDGVTGTADVFGLTDDAVVVADHKTGWMEQPPAREHLQALWYGVAAADFYAKRRAIVIIIRIRDDGTVWSDIADLNGLELDDAAFAIDIVVMKARRAKPDGKVTTGEHCRYCPAFRSCPATVALAKIIGEDARMVGEEVRLDLTPENAARAWDRVKLAEKIIDEVKDSLKTYAETVGPFQLANGNVVGPVEVSRRSPDAMVTLDVLTKLHGETLAKSAVKFEPTTSLSAIKEAIGIVAPKGKAAALVREAEAQIESLGGMKVSTFVSVKEHKAKKEIA